MSKVIICDVCGQRLDAASLEGQQRHVRAVLRFEQLGRSDVVIERDFCEACAAKRELDFSQAPFTESLSSSERARP